MTRFIFIYGVALAVSAFLLEWLEFKVMSRAFAGEFYILLIAAAFTGLGVWAGARLTAPPAPRAFEKNEAALIALGVTAREFQTLELLAQGMANKEIARAMAVSPNTIKTHLSKLYDKLGARRRTEAIQRARAMSLIP